MKPEPKYAMGGYHLPVRVEFPTLAASAAIVVDAKGRVIKRFASANEARKLVARLNESSNVRVSESGGEKSKP